LAIKIGLRRLQHGEVEGDIGIEQVIDWRLRRRPCASARPCHLFAAIALAKAASGSMTMARTPLLRDWKTRE
jgi:hypothetical protein